MNLQDSVGVIKGIGPKKMESLKKLNIITVEDLMHHYPRDYLDRSASTVISALSPFSNSMVRARVTLIVKGTGGYKKGQTLKLLVEDTTGILEVVFFNAKFLVSQFRQNEIYDFYGRITRDKGRLQMVHPEYYKIEGEGPPGILPVYPLVAGVSQAEMRKWMNRGLGIVKEVAEYLPQSIIEKNRLCSLETALIQIHKPENRQRFKEAKYRLVFDELLCLQLGLLALKQRSQPASRNLGYAKDARMADYVRTLPFKLTGAQERVIQEINGDMERERPMNRLIQGDVGSGKTAVAEAAIYKAVKSGFQAAMMAPTEILAKQHYEGLKSNFEPLGIRVGFLGGNMPAKERRQTLLDLETGKIQVITGTHAIIQAGVVFHKLALVITDEQHRFGVGQRISLASKGDNVDILVMTATPIPRTLAVIIYGDLDISLIDELPPGRQKTVTKATDKKGRRMAYELLERELEKGRQGYVVTPLIGESEVVDAISAEEVFEELKNRWTDKRIEILHGDVRPNEKDRIMTAFYKGEIQVLVATVVIEVGINVPNATVMLIENAERFGLAQLHQLRGRVGRGREQSYCLLVSKGKTELSRERAKIMTSSTDGFVIAEKDLELRGPGEFFGTRQHGLPDLKMADLIRHIQILNLVREEAKAILSHDSTLEKQENRLLRQEIQKMFKSEDGFNLSL